MPTASTSSAPAEILGRTEPRLWTAPLRDLTPDTSYGFDVVRFADEVVGQPLDPWEEWAVIHAGELLPDGRPRFRKLLIIVARQNGKTELLVILTLFWLFIDRVSMVLGTSTKLDYAAESWRKACRLVRRVPSLKAELPPRGGIRKANGEQVLWRADEVEYALDEGSRYKIAASNEEGGRSLTIDRLVLDELRHHYDYSAWDASVNAMNAVSDAQVIAISNQGDDRSMVLNEFRESALHFIETGEGDPRQGLLEWSSHEDASPLDVDELAYANPNLGRRIDVDTLLGEAMTAVQKGGDKLAGFKTENMCIRVRKLDPAVDLAAWAARLEVGSLDDVRGRVLACIDVSLDGLHATMYAAALLDDGRARVDPVAAWSGSEMRNIGVEVGDLLELVRPQAFGWFPSGPAAAIGADIAEPPEGVELVEIRGDVKAVCMGFAKLVGDNGVVHSGDPLLDAHLGAAVKLWEGEAWRFGRRGVGHVDAAYAAAGAVHLARTLPVEETLPRSEIY